MTSGRTIRSKFYLGVSIFFIVVAFEFIFYNKIENSYPNKNNKSKERSFVRFSSDKKKPKGFISDARINVIVAYMRTGSTFVAATLQEYPKTFYFYEPTRSVWRKFMNHSEPVIEILYPNGTKTFTNPTNKIPHVLREITNYMTCSFDDITVTSLMGKEHRRTNEMINLWLCTKKVTNNTHEDAPLKHISNWTRCLEEARHKCLSSSVRLFKFIRIRLSEIKTLLPKFPNMKILYLNRDPRAIFYSRASLPKTAEVPSFRDVKKHCNEWLRDIQEAKAMTERYPGRFKSVRYEDIAQQPAKQFTDIATFFGIEFEPQMRAYLKNITSVGRDGGIWEVKRANPYNTSQRWRRDMKFDIANSISKSCQKGMKELHYYQFDNEHDMRNFSLHARGYDIIGKSNKSLNSKI